MAIKTFYHAPTFTLTYVVYDEATKDAVIIDPVLDYDPLASQTSTEAVDDVIAFVEAQGLHVYYVLETHAHADHLSGAQLLAKRFEATTVIGEKITVVQETFKGIFDLPEDFATDGSQFGKLMANGEKIAAGSIEVEAIATPGHTPACMTYKIGDAIFTGDALFMEDYGTGRCDFPNGSAEDLYRSVHDVLYALPDSTRVFVGHDYQPGGRELRYETTLEAEKLHNVQLKASTSKEDFVEFRAQRDATLRPPRLIYQSVQVNVNAGRLPKTRGTGHRYLEIPINLFGPTDDIGRPQS